jgi:hypothetical protein
MCTRSEGLTAVLLKIGLTEVRRFVIRRAVRDVNPQLDQVVKSAGHQLQLSCVLQTSSYSSAVYCRPSESVFRNNCNISLHRLDI